MMLFSSKIKTWVLIARSLLGFIYLVFGLDYFFSFHTLSTPSYGQTGSTCCRAQRHGVYLSHDEDNSDTGWFILTLWSICTILGGCTFPDQPECFVVSYHPCALGLADGRDIDGSECFFGICLQKILPGLVYSQTRTMISWPWQNIVEKEKSHISSGRLTISALYSPCAI